MQQGESERALAQEDHEAVEDAPEPHKDEREHVPRLPNHETAAARVRRLGRAAGHVAAHVAAVPPCPDPRGQEQPRVEKEGHRHVGVKVGELLPRVHRPAPQVRVPKTRRRRRRQGYGDGPDDDVVRRLEARRPLGPAQGRADEKVHAERGRVAHGCERSHVDGPRLELAKARAIHGSERVLPEGKRNGCEHVAQRQRRHEALRHCRVHSGVRSGGLVNPCAAHVERAHAA
mmetsp:Transcript_25327/g.74371  ORF Transcript_25327/g.74371 Transcript_25327/m.74371 type:complete len:231 (+) Transcript_25327:620-1312(+)